MARLLVEGNTLRDPERQQFEMEGWVAAAPFEELLGMEILEAAQGRAVLAMPFTVKLSQGGGLLHGGALTALADTAVAMAIKSLLRPNTIFATTELRTEFLAPVRQGTVTASAVITGPEGRTFRGQVRLADQEGREVARFSSVFRVARGQGYGE